MAKGRCVYFLWMDQRCSQGNSRAPEVHLLVPRESQATQTKAHRFNSSRHIVDILKNNPDKDPDRYREEDIDHMRKVVSYCKRHLAQEEQVKKDTRSKSYKSLKNWGHDALKET